MAGTFTIVQPTVLVSLIGGRTDGVASPGWYNPLTGEFPVTDADLLLGLTPLSELNTIVVPNSGVVTQAIVVNFDQSTPIFLLDGSLVPISFNSLPSGFVITSALLNAAIFGGILNGANGVLTFSYGFLPNVVRSMTGSEIDITNFQFAPTGSLSPLDFISNRIGFSAVIDTTYTGAPTPIATGYIIGAVTITGTYTIQASQFTLLNASTPIYVGDKIKVTTTPPIIIDHNDPNPPPGVLQGVQEIHFNYTDFNGIAQTVIIDQNSFSTYVIVQDSNNLWFYLPPGFGSFKGPVLIILVGDGVQFSGSVVLGTLQILFEDATGIYSLMKNQTDDVLYFRAGFTTDIRLIMLSDESYQDEIDEESFFNMLPYPRKILAQTNFDEDLEGDYNNFFITSVLRTIIITKDVEIPSPFIKTAFLP